MKGLLFKSLSAQYIAKNEYIIETEENYSSVFSCKYYVSAVYDRLSDYYNFKINRSDVLIDGKPVRKLMDRIIFEIGNSIYPISLTVSPQMNILDVVSFEEITRRWTGCTQLLLAKYPSHQMKRYVEMSKNNILDKTRFIRSLYQDSFFNVYFRNIYIPTVEGEAMPVLWVNFPKRKMNQTYLYQICPIIDHKIKTRGGILQIVPDMEGDYNMDYELGDKGEIQNIIGVIESKHQNKLYTKQISVKAKNLSIDNHFTENIIIS